MTSISNRTEDTDVVEVISDVVVPDRGVVRLLRDRVATRLSGTCEAEKAAVVTEEITRWAHEQASHGACPPSEQDERHLAEAVLAEVSGLGGLQPLVERADVENVHIHGHDRVFVELADGRLQRWPAPVADSDEELLDMLGAMFARLGQTSREFSPAQPIGNLRLPAGGPLGSRLAAVREVSGRPHVAIRRHRLAHATLADLRRLGSLDADTAHFLACCVDAGVNMLVTGGPFAGKTTLLRALCHRIPAREHVVTVEDDYELGLHLNPVAHPLVTALEARTANAEGIGAITMDDLLTQALRHSPARVIVGEVRGGEITSLLRALGNGAAGGMGTLHATSAHAVPDRIAALGQLARPALPIEAAHRWTACALDLIVHVARRDDPVDGTRERFVAEVVEVGDVGDAAGPDLTPLFAPGPDGGRAVPVCSPSPRLRQRLVDAGLDLSLFRSMAPGW